MVSFSPGFTLSSTCRSARRGATCRRLGSWRNAPSWRICQYPRSSLSAKTTPDEARDDVISRITADVKPKLIDVAEIVRAYRKKTDLAQKPGKRSAAASPGKRALTVRTGLTKTGARAVAASNNPDAKTQSDGQTAGDERQVRCTSKACDTIQNHAPRAGKKRSYRAVISSNDDGVPVIRRLTPIRPTTDM